MPKSRSRKHKGGDGEYSVNQYQSPSGNNEWFSKMKNWGTSLWGNASSATSNLISSTKSGIQNAYEGSKSYMGSSETNQQDSTNLNEPNQNYSTENMSEENVTRENISGGKKIHSRKRGKHGGATLYMYKNLGETGEPVSGLRVAQPTYMETYNSGKESLKGGMNMGVKRVKKTKRRKMNKRRKTHRNKK